MVHPLRISESIVPVSDFKAQAAEWLRRVGESGQPLVITQLAGRIVPELRRDDVRQPVPFAPALEPWIVGLENLDGVHY